MILQLNLPLSLINPFLTYAVWFSEIKDRKIFFNLRAVFEINSESTSSKKIGLQFSMKRLSLRFFPYAL